MVFFVFRYIIIDVVKDFELLKIRCYTKSPFSLLESMDEVACRMHSLASYPFGNFIDMTSIFVDCRLQHVQDSHNQITWSARTYHIDHDHFSLFEVFSSHPYLLVTWNWVQTSLRIFNTLLPITPSTQSFFSFPCFLHYYTTTFSKTNSRFLGNNYRLHQI
jgi:hypothetical protein